MNRLIDTTVSLSLFLPVHVQKNTEYYCIGFVFSSSAVFFPLPMLCLIVTWRTVGNVVTDIDGGAIWICASSHVCVCLCVGWWHGWLCRWACMRWSMMGYFPKNLVFTGTRKSRCRGMNELDQELHLGLPLSTGGIL